MPIKSALLTLMGLALISVCALRAALQPPEKIESSFGSSKLSIASRAGVRLSCCGLPLLAFTSNNSIGRMRA